LYSQYLSRCDRSRTRASQDFNLFLLVDEDTGPVEPAISGEDVVDGELLNL
jgi:hypothetical protein